MDKIDIRQFKLLNGDDIIAVLAVKNDDSYIIERPLSLTLNILGNWTLQPWFPLSSQKMFKLYKTRVMQHVPLDEDIKKTYIEVIMANGDKPRAKSPIQTVDEALDEMERIVKEQGHLDGEEYPELEDEIENITIH